MSAGKKLFRGALMLTGVNLLLRFVSTSFQVYLSGAIGAAGVGLLQLVMSVSMMAMTLGAAGGRTTAMYLAAEELGRGNAANADRLLGGCFVYCVLTGGAVGLGLYFGAPTIAQHWIGSMDALPALRTWAAFLPLMCLTGVMTGYFTAANRIGTLAAVEVAEQFFTMAVTVAALSGLQGEDPAGSCKAVVLGNCLGSVLTLVCLLTLYPGRKLREQSRIPAARRILSCAVPLAAADDLKAGISALENLMVPRRLALHPGVSNPLAAFGVVSGMVFPVMMFPAAILYSLAEVLIPELARCAAVGSKTRIQYLLRRNLRVTLLYGLACGGLLWLLAEPLCGWLYPETVVAPMLKRFALLVPMLYCDLIVDGMTKGLGEQKSCVRYSIISNIVDVALMFFLLPKFGVDGYYASFALTHALNFALSLRRLLKIGGVKLNFHFPALAVSAALLSAFGGSCFTGPVRRIAAFLGLFFSVSYYFGVLTRGDLRWARNLLTPGNGQRSKRPL